MAPDRCINIARRCRATAAAVVLVVALASIHCRTEGPVIRPARRAIEVQGHRGCRGLRPENTMAAFEHAVALGVDVIELDVGLTRDQVLVVAHDPEVNPELCLGADRLPGARLRDLTYAQLRQLDCGSRRNPRFPEQQPVPGAQIPRLEQVLELLRRHPGLRANVEIKTFADGRRQLTFAPARFAGVLVPLLLQSGLGRRVTVQSFDPLALQAVARIAGGRVTLAALADRRADFQSMLEATSARILSPRHSELRREDVAVYRRRGVRVIPWTVNKPARMREIIGWGVDGIITDRPDRLLRILGRRDMAQILPPDR